MPIYHFHATKQTSNSCILHIDGIAIMEKPVVDMDGYKAMKEQMAKDNSIDGADGITICSLTLLHNDS